ncbi:MAG: hypothetical protein ACJA13_001601 [Paraglaciecola sp.]|jgi:hypothetical protein
MNIRCKVLIYSVASLLIISQSLVFANDKKTADFIVSSSNIWQAVPDSTLASLRGGFVLPNGMIVDISFKKSIFQNGELTSQSYFESPENLSLLNKDNFTFSSDSSDALFTSIIQNNLDNQTLTSITNIDISIKNLNDILLALTNSEIYSRFTPPNTYP